MLDEVDAAANEPAFELWPENRQAFEVWNALRTQWRVGMAGAIGLDYAALPAVLDLLAVPAGARRALFDALRDCEAAALECLHEEKGTR